MKPSAMDIDDENIPRAIRSETMRVGNIEILVHVLDDGRRIVDRDSFVFFLSLFEDKEAQ